MLGTDMMDRLQGRAVLMGVDIGDFDIADEKAVRACVADFKPSVVLNLAAYTNVDGAESERELAHRVNAVGAGNIAAAAKDAGARLVHISTDYVFDGEKNSPYKEEDSTGPINEYGRSKLEGEKLVASRGNDWVIIRTEWLYGLNGKNFVKTILKASRAQDTLKVVNDQVGSPTFTADLAGAVEAAIELKPGIYNATNSGYCSWYDFTVEILRLARIGTKVIPITSGEISRPARRPKNSRLDCSKFEGYSGMKMRGWKEALSDYMKKEKIPS